MKAHIKNLGRGNVNKKLYLVDAYAGGEEYGVLGVFTTREKAEAAKEAWMKKNSDWGGVTIHEIEVDKYYEMSLEG